MATGAVEANGASRASQKKPDWGEFYKNGLPKEVIVIDDDDDDDEEPVRGRAKAVPASGPNRQPDKRRKTGAAAAYDAGYSQQSSSQTQSTDRTASALTTTAPTSYASQTSTRTHLSQADRSGVAGQKRKRAAQPGASEAAQNKRRNVEAAAAVAAESLLGAYVPPPKPPIKAKDVVVKVVPDVSDAALVAGRGCADAGEQKSARGHRIDDEDGHYLVAADADLTDRCIAPFPSPSTALTDTDKIAKMLGQGTFGKVVEAFDRQKHTKCAIKIIRSVPKYRDASRIELRVLTTLASNDKHNRNRCIHLRDCFDFRNHICIVTDLYSQSVFDFLKANSFVPFPSSHIQTFAKQLLASVACMCSRARARAPRTPLTDPVLHDLHLIHTDLKPENILLVNSNYQMFTYNRNTPSSTATGSRLARHRRVLLDPEIRLIDFGSATFHDEYHSSVVSTRHYRAPEIILNLGWSYPCDIWSIGCILVEFYTGDALFQTHDNLEHLAMMETVCGYKLDKELVKQVNKQDRSARNSASGCVSAELDALHADPGSYFKGFQLHYPNKDTPKASKKYVRGMKRLEVGGLARCGRALTGGGAGHGPGHRRVQPPVPRPSDQDLCVRSQEAHHGQAGAAAPLVPRAAPRRRHRGAPDQIGAGTQAATAPGRCAVLSLAP